MHFHHQYHQLHVISQKQSSWFWTKSLTCGVKDRSWEVENIIFGADLNTSWHIWKRDWTLTNGQAELNWTLCQGLGGSLTIRIFASPHQKIEASSASLFLDHTHSRRGWHVRPPSYPIRPLEVVRKVVHGWIIRVINERGNIPRRFRNYAVVSARRKK